MVYDVLEGDTAFGREKNEHFGHHQMLSFWYVDSKWYYILDKKKHFVKKKFFFVPNRLTKILELLEFFNR